MAKKTSIKLMDFEYGPVRAAIATAPTYTKCQGLLKGFTLSQEDPNATKIDSELLANPYATIYKGTPIVFKFELVNFDLEDLPPLFGGTYTAGVAGTSGATYDAPDDIYTTNHEWKVSFQKGLDSMIMFNGLTMGIIKKEADGALSYSVTVTAETLIIGDSKYTYRLTDKTEAA